MKISHPRSKKNLIIYISLGVVVLLVVAAFLYVYKFDGNLFGWTTKSNTQDTTTDKQVESTDEQKEAGDNTTEGGSDKPPSPAPQTGSDKKTVEVLITAANQNSGVLQVRALISTVVNTGNCTLTLTKSGQTVTKTADTQALSSTSTCKGFDIPVSELSSGSWQLNLIYENDSLKGTASKIVTVE